MAQLRRPLKFVAARKFPMLIQRFKLKSSSDAFGTKFYALDHVFNCNIEHDVHLNLFKN